MENLKMNKAFKKYGKAKFSSIIPRRLKSKRAVRIALAADLSAKTCATVNAIRNSVMPPSVNKSIAISKALLSGVTAINKTLTRSDHPIQARKE